MTVHSIMELRKLNGLSCSSHLASVHPCWAWKKWNAYLVLEMRLIYISLMDKRVWCCVDKAIITGLTVKCSRYSFAFLIWNVCTLEYLIGCFHYLKVSLRRSGMTSSANMSCNTTHRQQIRSSKLVDSTPKSLSKSQRKSFDSLFVLVVWHLWKERNSSVFNNASSPHDRGKIWSGS
ncbi:hypothetical protein PAHAL_4G340400 [Panicum hallii]|uniref:Uncharacterized protein n=1 Tax=Panicum hallii TaxID=206008 RepID=A0A2S3HM53_9POAL|nr:hypothetical protein PAHAL_4G340400 [Panicum hallii]